MRFMLAGFATAFVLLVTFSSAHANTTQAYFVDVSDSLSFDGWNQLSSNRIGSELTEAQLVAGIVANVVNSGDAVLTRISGAHIPTDAGLYLPGQPSDARSVFTFTDNTIASGIDSLVFQGIINDFAPGRGFAPFALTLSYNGGVQNLHFSVMTYYLPLFKEPNEADLYTFTWDLSGLGPINSYTLTLDAGFSQMLAFQVDQVAAVPEPETYAMFLVGVGAIGAVARRRTAAAKG